MAKYYFCLFLQRILLPLVLVTCAFIRPVAISLVYLFMFFVLPYVPVATTRNIKGPIKAYFIILISVSILLLLGHIGLNSAIWASHPEELLASCSEIGILLRHIGFISLSNLNALAIVEWIVPEILVCVVSVLIYVLLVKLNAVRTEEPAAETTEVLNDEEHAIEDDAQTRRKRSRQISELTAKNIRKLGPFFSLITIFLASAFRPSVPGGLYFLVFLISTTYWACFGSFKRGFAIVLRLLMVVLLVHSIAILAYQTPQPQNMLPANSTAARLAGLEPLFKSTCDNGDDIRIIDFNDNVNFDSYLNPVAVLVCFYILALTSNVLMKEKIVRNNTVRKSSSRRDDSLSMPLDPLTDLGSDAAQHPGIMDQISYGFYSVGTFIYQNSYIFTNIVMMAWSIIYHSWLTFVLLIWANILWMIPNQRKTMLRWSPLIVLYAEILLIAQYIYGMNLTDDELPSKVDTVGINLLQIGLSKPKKLPCVPLMVKTIFTTMFWTTLRQLFKEEKEKKQCSTLADMVAPLQLTVGAATADLAQPQDPKSSSKFLERAGEVLKMILVKLWIWLLIFVIFLSGITGNRMTGFRIFYMAFFLFFLLAFQLSWKAWTKIMFGFWLVLIFYAMSTLILIYTYQFDRFPNYWQNYLNVSETLQKDIGLEKHATKDLFLHLVNPTVIVIMTVIQVHYFHKRFLASLQEEATSNTRSATNVEVTNGGANIEESKDEQKQVVKEVDEDLTEASETIGRLGSLRRKSKRKIGNLFQKMRGSSTEFMEFLWLFLEIHSLKLIYIVAFVFCVTEVCVLHIMFAALAVIAIMSCQRAQIVISRLISVLVAVLLLTKMIYQVQYIKQESYNVYCNNDTSNSTNTSTPVEIIKLEPIPNNAIWFGLEKISAAKNLLSLLQGYIAYLIVVTVHAVVIFRQAHMRAAKGIANVRQSLIFEKVTRQDAEKDLLGLIKYLFNYGFYKFGLEVTFISLVALISYRQDLISILYALWLCALFYLNRTNCAKLWIGFQCFTAIAIVIQYLIFVGVPPGLCVVYPWQDSPYLKGLQAWAMLPGPLPFKRTTKLIFDYLLLVCICRQARVFATEKKFQNLDFPGGTNKSIIHEIENLGVIHFDNPTPDFIANVRNWLDILKVAILTGFFWVTLAVVFLSGTNIISCFSVGYLIGSFIFLWQGTDFYLRPINKILKWWYILLAYNVVVITVKTLLQIAGCLFLSTLKENVCWFVHLFGISCTSMLTTIEIDGTPIQPPKCPASKDVSGITWDAICFTFLLFQLRIFGSYYFCHIINDTKASTILASRGAELIEDLRQKQIQHKIKCEKEVLRKIKKKMEKIRATQQKMLRPIEKPTHFDEHRSLVGQTVVHRRKPPKTHPDAIRAGDYYMFDDLDEKIELDLMDEEKDFLEAEGEISPSELKMSKRKNLLEHEKKEEKKSDESRKSIPSTSKDEPDGSGKLEEDEEKEKVEAESPLIVRLIEGLMVSIAIRLNRLSRNYRYVMKILEKEKKILKETKGFEIGARTGAGNIWTPFKFIKRPASSDREIDTKDNTHDTQKQTDKLNDENNGSDAGMQGSMSSKYGTPRQELIQMGELYRKEQDDINTYEEEFTSRDHHIAIEVMIALWYAILSNTDIVCYVIVFVNQIVSASVLSLPLPLMVFLWGTLALPRPTKTFWVTLIAYTQSVVLIKCVSQVLMIWFSETASNQTLSAAKIMGIEYRENYATYDLLLLLILFFHRFILKSQGLWKSDYEETTIKEEALVIKDDLSSTDNKGSSQEIDDNAIVLKGSETLALIRQDQSDSNPQSVHVSNYIEEPGNYLPGVVKITSVKYCSSVISFFKDLLHKPRLPSDVYACLFFCDFINFFVLLFGFTAFGSQQGDGGVQTYITENKVPIPFLIMLLLQFVLIIVDRALYLRKALMHKIIFHFALVIGLHIWMFFVIPSVTERNFNDKWPPVIFYMIKCFYLVLSSYQIRCGYPTRILGNFLTKSFSLMNMVAFKVYKFTPFLFELRTFMDWLCTDTTMTLFDWLKMEDIFSNIYFIKCSRQMEKDLPSLRAEKKSLPVKLIMGGSVILILTVLVWGPLALSALLNTVGHSNLPYEITFSLTLGPYEPVYQMTAVDYNIHQLDSSMWKSLTTAYKGDKSALTFIESYDQYDVAAMVLRPNSTSLWNISPPNRNLLMDDLYNNRTVVCRFKFTVSRETQDDKVPKTKEKETSFKLDQEHPTRKALIDMLEGKPTNDSLILPFMLPKFVKVKNYGDLGTIPQLTQNYPEFRNFSIVLHYGGSENRSEWWELKESCRDDDPFYKNILRELPLMDCNNTIVMYTFNDKLFPSTFSFLTAGGIISMYATYVLVASRLLRGITSGMSQKIMFEDLPYVDRVLQLCLDIYLVREALEFTLEEDLFAKLLFLYRSPETMIKWTRPKEEASDDESETESLRSSRSRARGEAE